MAKTILIQNALVCDGTGETAPFTADVLIENGLIAAVERNGLPPLADEVIDASGLTMMPGFIDTHTHSDVYCLHNRQMVSSLCQGVTTEITGPDGLTYAPLGACEVRDYGRYLQGLCGPLESEAVAGSMASYLKALDGCAVNVCAQVGHGVLRLNTVGFWDVPLRGMALERAKQIMRRCFEEGAVGFSTGMSYFPGAYCDTDELIALCSVAREYGAPFSIHMRFVLTDRARFGGKRLSNVEEALTVARQSGVALLMSHYHTNASSVGRVEELCAPFEKAMAEGADIVMETYPYHAGSGYAVNALPPWAVEGGFDRIMERLETPAIRKRIIEDILQSEKAGRGPVAEDVFTQLQQNGELLGMNYQQAAELRGQSIEEMLVDILREEELAVGYRKGNVPDNALYERLNDDFVALLHKPYYVIGSDGIAAHAFPHPRTYGSFAKFLRIAYERGMLMEAFAYHASGLPARTFGLEGRGIIRTGAHADLVLLDPGRVREGASFDHPVALPQGIPYVLVNGRIAVRDGRALGVLAGRALKRRSF